MVYSFLRFLGLVAMRKCFWCGVAGAGVGSFSMFKFPVEVELRLKWCAAMGTCVDKGDKKYLCCAHFNVRIYLELRGSG